MSNHQPFTPRATEFPPPADPSMPKPAAVAPGRLLSTLYLLRAAFSAIWVAFVDSFASSAGSVAGQPWAAARPSASAEVHDLGVRRKLDRVDARGNGRGGVRRRRSGTRTCCSRTEQHRGRNRRYTKTE